MRWIYALILSLPLQCAWAQQNPPVQQNPAATRPAPQSMPTPEEVNPAVDTTPAATSAPSAVPASPATGTQAPAAAPAAAKDTPAPDSKGPGKSAARGARGARGASPDRVELGTTDITGNRELPKVLYIVPWKRSDLGDLVGKPPNSLLDEVLQPIDRDVFLRENRYYDALQPGRAAAPADSVQGSGDKPSP